MQVPTSLFYDRTSRAMQGLSAKADALQTQLSSGKRLSAPSSDSAAYTRLQSLHRDLANDGAYGANLTTAAGALQTADTALGAISTQLQRAQELALRAANGTLDPSAKAAIGLELNEIVAALTDLGNARDQRGQPVFGGGDGKDAVVRGNGGSFSYAGSTGAAIPVAEGQSVQPGIAADRVFGLGDRDILGALATLGAALVDGSATKDGIDAALGDLDAASDQVSAAQGSIGARAARVETQQALAQTIGTDREAARSALEDTDYSATVVELQKTMTILSATQASFTKLAGLTLFDYLR